jgi:hypothetical protein
MGKAYQRLVIRDRPQPFAEAGRGEKDGEWMFRHQNELIARVPQRRNSSYEPRTTQGSAPSGSGHLRTDHQDPIHARHQPAMVADTTRDSDGIYRDAPTAESQSSDGERE